MPGQFESILDKLQAKLGKQTIRKASTINRPRPKREVQQIQIFNEFNRRNPRADGGSVNGSYEAALRKKIEELMDEGYEFGEAVREAMRQGYQDGGQTMVQQANELGISKSALRKPFAPEIEKQIIKLHQVDKLGAQAIADKLGLSRAPVGKRITALKKEGKIKEVPYAERKAAIDQRGEFFGKPAGEKFQKIREVRDIDRTTKYKVGPQAGQLKYNIPKNAKFKIDFKNPGAALVSEIPDNLQGVQYYKTKEAAEKALAKRKSLQLLSPADPNSPVTKAGVKRRTLLKRNAPLYAQGTGGFEFHHIMNIGGPIPLDTNDIAVISKTMNRKLGPYNKRLNNIGEKIFELTETRPEGYLKEIKKLNKQGISLVKEATSKLPKEYKKLIGFNQVVPVFDKDKNVIGFKGKKIGGSGQKKPGIILKDLTKEQAKDLRKQIKTDSANLGKAKFSKRSKVLSSAGKILKGVGKVIKPIGYVVGAGALLQARAMADEMGIQLSTADQLMALDSGDPNVAIDNYKRRNIPGYSEEQAGITLGKFQDDFTEVGDESFTSYFDGGIVSVLKGVK